MKENSYFILPASVFVFLFYLSSLILIKNIYDYAVIGALFELLWLPALLLLFGVPIFMLVQLFRKKLRFNTHLIISTLLLITTCIMIMTYN